MEVEIYQRNTLIFNIALKKSDGTPYDLSTANLQYIFEIENDRGTVEIIKNMSDGIAIKDSAAGKIRVEIPSGELNIEPGEYTYELLIIDNDAGTRETYISDTLIVKESIIN